MNDPAETALLGPLQEGLLRAALLRLNAEKAVSDVHILDETRSSNDEASQHARNVCPDKTIIFAESQSAGRGRRGNVWSSPSSRDLLFSLVLYSDNKTLTDKSLRLPHLIALTICEAIESIDASILCQIKWPNDIYIGGKKVAGILVESASQAGHLFFIVGIGINVNSLNCERPAELYSTATSLREETHHLVDRHKIAAAFLARFNQVYPQSLDDFAPVLQRIKKRSTLIGHQISALIDDKEIIGRAIDFASNGELVIEKPSNQGTKQQIIYSADHVRLV